MLTIISQSSVVSGSANTTFAGGRSYKRPISTYHFIFQYSRFIVISVVTKRTMSPVCNPNEAANCGSISIVSISELADSEGLAASPVQPTYAPIGLVSFVDDEDVRVSDKCTANV